MAVLAWRFVTTGGVEMLRAHARRPQAEASLVTDPVCRMSVDPATAGDKAAYKDVTHHFCSPGCHAKFDKDSARYAVHALQVEHAGHLGHSGITAAVPTEEIGGEMERNQSAVDPVCGMNVDAAHAEYRSVQSGQTYYFCSAGCKETFDKDPGKYVAQPKAGPRG